MKLNKIPVCGAIVAAVLFGAPSFAQEIGDPSQPPEAIDSELYLVAELPPGGPGRGFFEDMGLTDDQIETLVNLKAQHELQTAQKKAEMKMKFHQLMDLVTAPAIDKQKVAALQNEINALHDDLANTRTNLMMQSFAVFTDDQRKMIRHMMHVHMLKMGMPCFGGGPGRMGKRFGPGCPMGPGSEQHMMPPGPGPHRG